MGKFIGRSWKNVLWLLWSWSIVWSINDASRLNVRFGSVASSLGHVIYTSTFYQVSLLLYPVFVNIVVKQG